MTNTSNAEQPATPAQQRGPAPIITDIKRANCPVVIGPKDENGNRELSFVVGAMELATFLVGEQTQKEIAEQFSGGIQIADALDLPGNIRE